MPHGRFTFATAFAVMVASVAPMAADAQYYGHRYDAPGAYYAQNDYVQNEGYARRGRPRGYRGGGPGYEAPPPGYYRNDAGRGRVQRRCDKGTGGTILGAIAGGLLGNAAAGRGDRGAGAIIGAGAGALAGRAVDRDC